MRQPRLAIAILLLIGLWVAMVGLSPVIPAPAPAGRGLRADALPATGDPVAAELQEREFMPPGIRALHEQRSRSVQTQQLAAGEFRLLLPGPEPCQRWLHAEGFAPTGIEVPAMVWPRTVYRLDVTMTPVVSTWVRVDHLGLPWPADPTGMAQNFTVVRLRPASRHLPGSARTLLAGRTIGVVEDEPAKVDLPAGTEWFASVGDGAPVRCRAGDREVVLRPRRTLELPRIELEVFRQDGARVSGSSLRCDEDEPFSDHVGLGRDFVELAADGAEGMLGILDGGRGTLVVTDPVSRQTAAIEIRSDSPERMRVVLQPPADLVVQVRCGSHPARGVEVRVTSFGEQRSEKVDVAGLATLCATPGAARLQVRRGNEVLVDRVLMLFPGRFERELPVAL